MTGELETLQALIDANDQPVFALDCDLCYTAFNRAHAEIMWKLYGAEIEIGGRLPDYQTVDADRDGALFNLRKALAGERVVAGGYSGDEARRRYYDIVHTPLLNADGAATGVVVRAHEVTDPRAENGLRESEERYALLFENLLEGCAYCRLLYDDEGRPNDLVYVAVNPAFERLTGLRSVTGRRVTDVIPTMMDETPELFQTYVSVVETGEPAELDVDFTPLNLWLHLSVFRPEPGHFVAVFADVTESRRAQQTLHDANERLHRSLAVAKAGTWEWVLDGGPSTWSPESLALHGFTPDQAAPDFAGWLQSVHREDREAAAAAVTAAAGNGADLDAEWRVATADGTLRWLHTRARAEVDAAGKLVRYAGVVMDVTSRKEAERAVRRSQTELRALVDTIPDIVFQVDRDYRLVIANAPFTRATVSAEGRPISPGDLVLTPDYPDDFKQLWRDYYDRAFAGETFMAETSVDSADGTRFLENYLSPVREESGEVTGVVVTSRDVTERRRAAEAVRESEARFRALFEGMNQGVVYQDADGSISDANPAAERILGLSLDQMQGRTSMDPRWRAVREDGSDFPGDEHPGSIALRTGRVVTDVVFGVFNPTTDSYHWIKVGAVPQFRPGESKPYQNFATFEDITELKRSERAARESESHYRGYFEQPLIGAAVTSPEKGWVDVNQALCDLLGYTRDELALLTWEELTHRDDLAADVTQFERVASGEIDGYRLEKRFLRKDGVVVDVDLSVQCQRKEDGAIDFFLALLSDITARKRAEGVRGFLARTGSGPQDEPFFEALARYLAESLGMFYVCIDRLEGDGLTARTVAVWCDDHFEDNVAYTLEDTPCGDVVGRQVCCFPAGVRRLFPRDEALQDLQAESYIGVTLFGHSGRPIGLIAVIGRAPLTDRALAETTLGLVAARAAGELERLDAEAELRETRDRLELAQRASGAGIWDWDVVTGVIKWSPELFELLGLDAETAAASFDAWNGAMHPDDLEVANARIATALAGHTLLDSEYRIVRPNGEVRWINALGQGVYGEQGKPLRMTGICIDVTERKRAEDEIQRLNADLERRVGERTRDLTAANTELEEFVYSISHDLRSPLRALAGFSQLVQMDYGDLIDDTGRDYLRRISDAAQHLGDLMDALLSLSKIGRLDLDLRDVDISALARSVASYLGSTSPERIVEVDIENGLVAHTDPALCEIIVRNLFENAWKFSAGVSPARISFSAECVDGQRTYVVRDNGVGFEPQYGGKLFTPFERLHTAEEFPGTGIGLATVRRAVTRLGGRYWAEGEPGGGAQVYFSLGEPC